MKPHISAITLAARDLIILKAFYTEKFGWAILAENEKVAMLKLDSLVLTLCCEALFKEYANISNIGGSNGFYITINLGTKAGIDEKTDQLQKAGVTILRQPSEAFWGGYSSFIADPEGNGWEICYNPYV